MMKVFLGNAPWQKGNRYGVRAGSRWPHWQGEGSMYLPFPFYLAYATAVLEQAGFECKVIDAIAEHHEDEAFIAEVVKFNPDIIVLETATPTIDLDVAIALKLKTVIPNPVQIVLCGPHVSYMKEPFLAENPGLIT